MKMVHEQVYVVGQVDLDESGSAIAGQWTICGVFTQSDLARAACVDQTYFVGPLKLDVAITDRPDSWPGAYFPKAE